MYSVKEIMQFVEENDVKFIRLSFCDGAGNLKNISIMPSNLQRVFQQGQQFDASPIFGVDFLMLRPDPSTLMAMPWRPSQGRVIRFFCDLYNMDGTRFKEDYRFCLRDMGAIDLECKCPFYLFKTDENGTPTKIWDDGGYFDVSPYDKGENIRREICLSLEEMNIPVLASFHGENAGQNIIIIKAASLLEAGDYITAFKFAAQAIAVRNGLFASFDKLPNQFCIIANDGARSQRAQFDTNLNPYIQLKGLQFK